MATPDQAHTEAPPRPPLWRRPVALIVAVSAIALLIAVLVLFQPQRLLYDVTVEDEFPAVTDPGEQASDEPAAPSEAEPGREEAAPPDAAEAASGGEAAPEVGGDDEAADGDAGAADDAPTAEEPAGPLALASGTFASRNRYTTTGSATVFELPDGSRTLRLEDFETTNGPDLYVYLTVADAADSDADLDADVVDLGDLRGNIGNQNYDIPADVDLERYDTVVIWCLRFTSSFGVADLSPAP